MYLTDLDRLAQNNDIGITECEFDSVDGMCMNGSKGYLIVVDSRLKSRERRFVISHEIGHIRDKSVNSHHSRIAEYRANTIAVDILIPDDLLRQAREEFGDDCDFIHSLFGVSIETLQSKIF